jgi:hypothetical protein
MSNVDLTDFYSANGRIFATITSRRPREKQMRNRCCGRPKYSVMNVSAAGSG